MQNSPTTRKLLIFLGALAAVFSAFFAVLPFLLAHLPEPIPSHAAMLQEGALRTLQLTMYSGSLGLFLGIVFALGTLSPSALFRWPCQALIGILRGTPLLVQILFVYFALPGLVPALKLDEFSASVIALTLNVGAYNSEVFRAGITAVPKGQTEAALSLGLKPLQNFIMIVFPQAFRIVLPPLVNNIVALLKDSSLASSIGLLELALAGNRISSETFTPVPVLSTIALLYLLLTSVLTLLSGWLERQLKVDLRR